MRAWRLALFLARLITRWKMLALAAAGTLLVVSDRGAALLPGRLLGFVVGSYAAALAALGASVLVASSGRFNEYAMSRLGCHGFAAGLGAAAGLAAGAAALASLGAAAGYSFAATGRLPSTWALVVGLYSAVLMGYGYALVAQLVRSSLPLLLLLALVARLARGSGAAVLIYSVPLAAAVAGAALQAAVCSSPALAARLLRGGRRWGRRLPLGGLQGSWREPRGAGSATYQ